MTATNTTDYMSKAELNCLPSNVTIAYAGLELVTESARIQLSDSVFVLLLSQIMHTIIINICFCSINMYHPHPNQNSKQQSKYTTGNGCANNYTNSINAYVLKSKV